MCVLSPLYIMIYDIIIAVVFCGIFVDFFVKLHTKIQLSLQCFHEIKVVFLSLAKVCLLKSVNIAMGFLKRSKEIQHNVMARTFPFNLVDKEVTLHCELHHHI